MKIKLFSFLKYPKYQKKIYEQMVINMLNNLFLMKKAVFEKVYN